ncbi:hypothetical protein IX306_001944 [Porphyromonas levii]|uniref:hypothetical protein n=1 Tax=Porphyromonas levii TaxID=28114 RepID=UPI001BAA79AF|nr:hypothetical protein [Porphyromonas levii]MBR8766558.1 hypothetical protein [Porphyromonas levii]MBR8774804.1 hypothetical protein [Porphyromonas levii]
MKDIEKNNTEAQKPFFYDLLSGGHGHKDAIYDKIADGIRLTIEPDVFVESQTFDVVHFIGDVLDNALSTAASQAGLDQYSFSDEFIDLISGEIQCSGEYSGKSFFEDLLMVGASLG